MTARAPHFACAFGNLAVFIAASFVGSVENPLITFTIKPVAEMAGLVR